jgi:hypothetical protein
MGDPKLFLLTEEVIKPPDAVQMAVDGLGGEPPGDKVVDVAQYLLAVDFGGGP